MTIATPGRTLGQEPGVEPATASAAGLPPPSRHRGQRLLGYAVMPVMLGLACVLLYVWVQGQELDSIERRLVNADVIRQSLVEHIQLAVVSTIFVILIAVPLGILLTRGFAKWASPVEIGRAHV